MGQQRKSLKSVEGATKPLRRSLGLKGEFTLMLLPTLTVLSVLVLVEVLSGHRLLITSLASSAFLIYLDPQHGTNTTRTLVSGHVIATIVGLLADWIFGPGYIAGASAMIAAIFLMILFDVVHPPAVSTALTFAFLSGTENSIVLFGLALSMISVLVVLQRLMLWLLMRFNAP